jgi:peptidoglycan/LPS O-acetylase OafA/YrhL
MNFLPDYSKRVYGLDVFRAIAITLVVHAHGSFMLKESPLEKFPWIRLIDGVDLFFVLSGFLIGGILLRMVQENHFVLSWRQVLIFWKRRWFRTLPNYYLILVVNIIFVSTGIINGRIDQFSYKFFFFIQNFHEPFYGFFWESWSLTIEEWFYIILPLLLVLILKLVPSKKGILFVLILMIIFPLAYRIINSAPEMNSFWWDVTFRKVVLMRLDTIMYGVLAAYFKFYHNAFFQKFARSSFFLGMIIIIATAYYPNQSNDFFTKTFFFNCNSIGAMLLLPYADSIKNFKTNFGKLFTHISLISYSMYLVNLGLVASVITKQFPVLNAADGLVKYTVYFAIVLVSSTLLYFFFEKPMLGLRDKTFFGNKQMKKPIKETLFHKKEGS